MQFSSVEKLNEHILFAVNEVIDDIAEEIQIEVRENVTNAYRSSLESGKQDYFNYTPTFEFLNSVTKVRAVTKKNTISIEIAFDPEKMQPEMRADEYWNAHASIDGKVDNVWNGMSVPELIPFWIEYGTKKGLYPRSGSDSVGKVMRLYEQVFPQLIIRELQKRYGIKAKAN